MAKRSEELAALQAKLAAAKAETGELREVVAAQELSPADVQRMCQERARLEEVRCRANAESWWLFAWGCRRLCVWVGG